MKSSVLTQDQISATLLPSSEDNSVITALKILGLYKKPLGFGKHDITCPWVDEHTNGRDNGTVYIENKSRSSLGGFKCQHTHCLHRTTQDFIAFLEKAITE